MFVDMPLDNRTVYRFAAPAATSGCFRLLETVMRKNDLMFRREQLFCNIEPKICQYG
jgi:hypothetical protein